NSLRALAARASAVGSRPDMYVAGFWPIEYRFSRLGSHGHPLYRNDVSLERREAAVANGSCHFESQRRPLEQLSKMRRSSFKTGGGSRETSEIDGILTNSVPSCSGFEAASSRVSATKPLRQRSIDGK